MQIGNYEFSTGDVTVGATTVTGQEFLERTGYCKYFVSNGFLNYKLDKTMIVKGTDGKRRVKLKAFSESLGIDDTINYWHDSGKMNVTFGVIGLQYNPKEWNDVKNSTNCYAYAMDLKSYPDGSSFQSTTFFAKATGKGSAGIEPGDIKNYPLQKKENEILKGRDPVELTTEELEEYSAALKNSYRNTIILDDNYYSNILNAIEADAKELARKFVKLDGINDEISSDMYRICLAYNTIDEVSWNKKMIFIFFVKMQMDHGHKSLEYLE